MQSCLELLKEWQTLVSALIALLAAVVTIVVMRRNTSRQIEARNNEEEGRRQRRLLACRAVMPADLSAIVDYTEHCAELSTTMHDVVREDTSRSELECPTMPERVVANLQLLIEHLDAPNAEAVTEMLSCFQVQHSRMRGLIGDYNHPHRFGRHTLLTVDNVESTFAKTVELHLRATNAFDFARRRADGIMVPPFTEEIIANSLANLKITDILSAEYRNFLIRAFSTSEE